MVGDITKVAIMVLGITSLFAGVPSAAMVVVLRTWQLEKSAVGWCKAFAVVKLWMLVAIIVAAIIAAFLIREAGLGRLAIVSIYYPIWCVLLAPSFVAFASLAMNRPLSRCLRRPQG